MPRLLPLLFALAITLTPAWSAQARPKSNPGFQTLSILDQTRHIRLDAAIWYPTARAARSVYQDGWNFYAAPKAKPLPGKHPLIVLSHDMAGSRFAHHWLATHLARQGFIVAAPTHRGDNFHTMDSIFTLDHIEKRVKDISFLIDSLLEKSPLAASVDTTRIGVIGFGPGGTAALLAAGGRLDKAPWAAYCDKADHRDPYCTPWIKGRLKDLSEAIRPEQTYRDPRVSAAIVIAPSYGMFFTANSLSSVSVPVLLFKAGLDDVNRAPLHADAIKDMLPRSPAFETLELADHPALTAACPRNLAQELPDLCVPRAPADRAGTHEQITETTGRFLEACLNGTPTHS